MGGSATRMRVRKSLRGHLGHGGKTVYLGRTPSIARQHGDMRGRRNEARALRMTKEILEQCSKNHGVQSCYVAERNSRLDIVGFDIVLETTWGITGFQVKSSQIGKDEFDEQERGIYCVIVNDMMDDPSVRETIASAVAVAVSSIYEARAYIAANRARGARI